jgi:hypothetical protein
MAVRWAVTHRINSRPVRHVARLVIDGAPDDASADDMKERLSRAGLAGEFTVYGEPWANHKVTPEGRWPDRIEQVDAAARGEELAADELRAALRRGQPVALSWDALEPVERRMTIRVPAPVHERAVLAAERSGQSLNEWAVAALDRAAVEQ